MQWQRLVELSFEQEMGGAAPEVSAPIPAQREPVSTRAGLASLFEEIEQQQSVPAGATKTSAASADTAAAETEIADTANAGEADQGGSPEGIAATPAIAAPAGMSEADKAIWQQLSPEAQAWVSARQSSMQSDYTQKTQAVAEQRRANEAAAQELMGRLQQYGQLLSGLMGQHLAPPPPELRNADPVAYDEQMARYQYGSYQQQIASAEMQRVQAEAAHLAQQQREQWVQSEKAELQRLASAMGCPDLVATGEKGRAARQAVMSYGLTSGYSQDQINNASARDIATLWKASQFDAISAARKNAKPVPQAAPKVQSPGPARSQPNKGSLAAAVSNLSKSGTRENLAAAYSAMLNSE